MNNHACEAAVDVILERDEACIAADTVKALSITNKISDVRIFSSDSEIKKRTYRLMNVPKIRKSKIRFMDFELVIFCFINSSI